MTTIPKPIIIVGTGRCGSTVFHRLLAKHPRVMWLSGFCDRYPTRPALNRRAVQAVSHPLLGPLVARMPLGRKIQPGECYKFWDKHTFGFSEPCRDLLRSDVSARVKRQVRAVMGAMLTPARDRLLVKITGWPRIGYLNEIFEDAKFVHIVRDGRAVASSLLHVNFWRGWYGPHGWRAGLLSPADQATWESYDRSFTALAGLEWRIQMRAIDTARRSLDPGRYLEVKYEDFCDRPLDVAHQVLGFAELPPSAALDRHIQATSLKSSQRWRDDLTIEQQKLLDDLLRDDLVAHGYPDPVVRPTTSKLPLADVQL
jgi:omega-hydroxy-beta-dihydromenaquinone-9 sulfotransferase